MNEVRHNWTKEEILAIYNKPMMELLYEAATVHRKNHNPNQVQVSTLLSIKTGGCSEDCGYCPQAARYHTDIDGNDLMKVSHVKAQALRAKAAGSSRVCMGAAWRNVKDGEEFDQVLEMVRTINKLDMEGNPLPSDFLKIETIPVTDASKITEVNGSNYSNYYYLFIRDSECSELPLPVYQNHQDTNVSNILDNEVWPLVSNDGTPLDINFSGCPDSCDWNWKKEENFISKR